MIIFCVKFSDALIGIQAQNKHCKLYICIFHIGNLCSVMSGTTFYKLMDDEISAEVPLGNFTFGAATYTACFINVNGYRLFGGVPASGVYTPFKHSLLDQH